ncbi:MAG: UDP-N-acetylmuramoyl-L-alanine--D-glutamate ligase [Deltaproteobacteria bacterium]|nr:UDP-N-acetylmuramoyl-L-alanine--D-glutamate ligase [Candidatus Zymogenaceae bacterium]
MDPARRHDLSGERVLVVGGALTGISVCRFLARRGSRVTLTDLSNLAGKESELSALAGLGVNLVIGGHRDRDFLDADLIVVSPGVPLFIESLVKAKQAGVTIIGDVELASWYLKAPILAVTGTNGKTTTTALLGEMLDACNLSVAVGGNIGEPLVDLVEGSENLDCVVAELSSFQLEAIDTFRPHVAVLLNITPDHLDRYPGFEEYVLSKMRIFENQTGEDYAVLNADDLEVTARTERIRPKRVCFSGQKALDEGVIWDDGRIVCRMEGASYSYNPEGSALTGVHNRENIMAAVAAAAVMGCAGEAVDRAIHSFRPAAHRLELVGEANGVRYFDDSKATNVGATLRSIESFDGGVHLIMGGVDKGGSYGPLVEAVKRRVTALYLMGEAADRIEKELGGAAKVVRVADMADAVRRASDAASRGDVVLLAPACSSFDMYDNYKERGKHFALLAAERMKER